MATKVEAKKARSDVSSILSGRRTDDRGLRTKSRRTGLVTVAAALMVACGLGFALLLSQAGETTSVLVVAGPVAKGHVVERTDLVSKKVAGADGAIETANSAQAIGKVAAVDLVAGQILTYNMVTSDPIPGAGMATVGLSLTPSRVPSAGLKAGSIVDVIAVPGGEGGGTDEELESPRILAKDAQVFSVDGAATEGGGVLVTLIVNASDSARLAAYSTSDRVAIVETSASDGGK
ncbi:hypothetical protein GCM10022234_21740 [Aeromicrobium panaciterrae]|uniref:SAF domain-containing protein n=1 Tax=Aeromicrobium panaciterrae TaxID=363861 RepID=UPI0031D2F9CC